MRSAKSCLGRASIGDSVGVAKSAVTLLNPVVRRLPAYSRLTWALLRDRRLRRRHRLLVLGGVAYLLSPIDLIPGIIPVLGQDIAPQPKLPVLLGLAQARSGVSLAPCTNKIGTSCGFLSQPGA